MNKCVTVKIADNEYRLVGTEDEEYTRKVAAHVDTKIREILDGSHVSMIDAAVLAGVNLADEYYKVLDTSDNLRTQLKDYLEESGRMKMEFSELKRENDRLRSR
ncbi:MAG: cell division protein ZapA [Clostridia bacterium]